MPPRGPLKAPPKPWPAVEQAVALYFNLRQMRLGRRGHDIKLHPQTKGCVPGPEQQGACHEGPVSKPCPNLNRRQKSSYPQALAPLEWKWPPNHTCRKMVYLPRL